MRNVLTFVRDASSGMSRHLWEQAVAKNADAAYG